MHIHIYIKLGFWQRIGIVATLLSGAFVTILAINHLPAQTDMLPCLEQLEAVKNTAPHKEILKNCDIDIMNAALKVYHLSFIFETLLKWLAAVLTIYGISLAVAWVRAGRAQD